MAVSGTMALSITTLNLGGDAISAQRGTQTWGANYVFSPSGLQNDIHIIADSLSGVYGNFIPLTSGTATIGTANFPLAVSGIVMLNQAGAPMKLVITAGGLVSGVAA